jgi:hypothetical protein
MYLDSRYCPVYLPACTLGCACHAHARVGCKRLQQRGNHVTMLREVTAVPSTAILPTLATCLAVLQLQRRWESVRVLSKRDQRTLTCVLVCRMLYSDEQQCMDQQHLSSYRNNQSAPIQFLNIWRGFYSSTRPMEGPGRIAQELSERPDQRPNEACGAGISAASTRVVPGGPLKMPTSCLT